MILQTYLKAYLFSIHGIKYLRNLLFAICIWLFAFCWLPKFLQVLLKNM